MNIHHSLVGAAAPPNSTGVRPPYALKYTSNPPCHARDKAANARILSLQD
ncbi:hypothetical protein M413DRAFT_23235 [Hebeloma cylindrosporum]|uniref:Uncharacterized protein n=1 Tax=Hebeloma cylindrosporum TaxID=76867 RepID=A0A0C3CSL4_HEBCY|nr:hypothetical protein M413DRAFT_23235 [Hebeloma cylindrosporum h7]